MKILLIAAMPTEIQDIVERFGMKLQVKLANFYPLYSVVKNNKEISLIQTHVGSINAPAATALALQQIKPDSVIKVGCVGGNSKGIKKNDIIVPLSFFHTGAWITKSYIDNIPTNDSSLWQMLFGDEPYQNSKENLGGLDFIFIPNPKLNTAYMKVLANENISYKKAHLGCGDMVIFDHTFMDNIKDNVLRITDTEIWCSDNESYAIAQVCKVFKIPFTGIYFVASSDYEDIEGYDPKAIQKQTQQTILPIVEKLVNAL